MAHEDTERRTEKDSFTAMAMNMTVMSRRPFVIRCSVRSGGSLSQRSLPKLAKSQLSAMHKLSIGIALMLAGCDQSSNKQTPAPQQPKQVAGPWVVVPTVSSGPESHAWRLNTQTGTLEFCFAGPGGEIFNGKKQGPSLACLPPVKADSD
jgi:hypothetical protein